MKKHYETHVEDTDKLISVAGPILEYKSWYEQYRKLMEEQAQRKYGLYTPTSEGDDDDFPSIPGMIARYSASGLTNEQMKENPVWVDKTGNGHDLQMKNFAWGGMSGVGGYKQDYKGNRWTYASSRADIFYTGNFINVTSVKINSVQLYYQAYGGQPSFTVPSYSVKVSGLVEGQNLDYRSSNNLRDNVVKPTDVKKDSFRMIGTGNSSNVLILLNESDSADWKIRITGMKEGDRCLIGNANKSGEYISVNKDGTYTFQKQYAATSTNGIWYNSSQEVDVLVEQIPEYEGYLVTDGVDDYGRAVGLTISKDFTLVGEWILFSKTSVNAGLSIHPQIHIFNRPEAIQIMFRTAGKTLPVKSLKAICSDGRCYDENWSELKINVGEFTDNKGTLFVASNGTNYAQIAFKNLGIYDNHILSKEDCIKAYNYLQTLKS